jgi:hypothetical protein
MVAKLCWNKGDAAHELFIANRVRMVDPHSTFTLIPLPWMCEVPYDDIPRICKKGGTDGDTDADADADADTPVPVPTWPSVFRLVMRNGGRPLSKDRGADESSQVAVVTLIRGMQELAACGIAHNDLHENNILVDDDRTLRIIDFGAAKLTSDERLLVLDLRNFLLAIRKWYGQSPAIPGLVLAKLGDLVRFVFRDGSGCAIYKRVPRLLALVWDADKTREGFRASLCESSFCITVMANLRPATPLDDAVEAMQAALERAYHPSTHETRLATSDYALAILEAWDEVLEDLTAGVADTDDVFRAYDVMFRKNTLGGRMSFWHRVTFYLPLVVGVATASVPSAFSHAPLPSFAKLWDALQAFKAVAPASYAPASAKAILQEVVAAEDIILHPVIRSLVSSVLAAFCDGDLG